MILRIQDDLDISHVSGVGTCFLLLNPTWLQIFKIQSKDAVKINFGLVE